MKQLLRAAMASHSISKKSKLIFSALFALADDNLTGEIHRYELQTLTRIDLLRMDSCLDELQAQSFIKFDLDDAWLTWALFANSETDTDARLAARLASEK